MPRRTLSFAALVAAVTLAACAAPSPTEYVHVLSEPGGRGPAPRPWPAAEEAAFQARARRLLTAAAHQDQVRAQWVRMGRAKEWDCHKYLWPIALARLALDPRDKDAWADINEFYMSQEYYHFAAIGLVRILNAHRAALPAEVKKNIAAFAMTPKNEELWTGSGTENHRTMWRTSGYLLAQEAGDARRMAEMKAWLHEFVSRLYAVGAGEWDSSTYYAFSLIGFMNLYDFAKDPEVREIARAALDWYTATYALKWFDNVQAGPEKRGHAAEPDKAITDYFFWLWCGDGTRPLADAEMDKNVIFATHAALSTYRPHPAVVALARKQGKAFEKPFVVRASKPDYEQVEPGRDRETIYIAPQFMLSSVMTPVGGYIGGDNQLVTWKLAIKGTKGAPGPTVITGGQPFSGGRSPWDQLVQYDDTLILMTKVPADAAKEYDAVKPRIEYWKNNVWPKTREIENPDYSNKSVLTVTGQARLDMAASADSGVTHIAISPDSGAPHTRAAGETGSVLAFGRAPKIEPAKGAWTVTVAAPPGALCGFVLEAGGGEKPGAPAAGTLSQEGDTVTYTNRHGDKITATFNTDPAGGVEDRFNNTRPGKEIVPRFAGIGARVAKVSVNGKPVTPAAKVPVYDSPVLKQDGGKLEVTVDSAGFSIDYSGKLPVYAEGTKR